MTSQLPKVLLARYEFEHEPEKEPDYPAIAGWFYETFRNVDDAKKKFPHISLVFPAKVWAISRFLKEEKEEAIIEIPELGAAVLSRKEISVSKSRDLHAHLVPHWLSYALSPELWGPQGKWTRFHSALHEMFKNKDLLKGDDFPGYYPLSSRAEKLSENGFIGTNLDKTYLLVLPWTFSLSALKKLEKVVLEEF